MRILHILESMGGGTKKHVQLLVEGLRTHGIEVVLALPHRQPYEAHSALMDYTFPDTMRAKGVSVEQFHMIHGRISPRDDIWALGELVAFLRRSRFDVVHTHSAKAGVLGRLAARLSGVPVIVHTPYSLPFRKELQQGRRYYLYYMLEKLLGQITDVMIATSRAELAEFTESKIISPNRIQLITNCFDLDNYPWSFDERADAKRLMGWPVDQPVIGTVARLSPQKGMHTLVKAAQIICTHLPQARFIIVGEGELRNDLARQAQSLGLSNDQWVMVGKRDDYLKYMRAFDIFAFPSLWEGLPYAPIEAMAVGTPVIATAVSGTTDLVTHSQNGLLVSAQNGTAMAHAILLALNYPTLARGLAIRGRQFVEEHFNSEKPVNQTLTAYREALRGRKRRG